jgi:hypothetical protein
VLCGIVFVTSVLQPQIFPSFLAGNLLFVKVANTAHYAVSSGAIAVGVVLAPPDICGRLRLCLQHGASAACACLVGLWRGGQR